MDTHIMKSRQTKKLKGGGGRCVFAIIYGRSLYPSTQIQELNILVGDAINDVAQKGPSSQKQRSMNINKNDILKEIHGY